MTSVETLRAVERQARELNVLAFAHTYLGEAA